MYFSFIYCVFNSVYLPTLAGTTGVGGAGVSHWLQSATSHLDGTESFTLDL